MFHIGWQIEDSCIELVGRAGVISLSHNVNVKKKIQWHLAREEKGNKTSRSNWGHIN